MRRYRPVAIPSNRVKRSKVRPSPAFKSWMNSRNPLKSGQAFKGPTNRKKTKKEVYCRNPLKSGQAFKEEEEGRNIMKGCASRNPLKSGQAFKDESLPAYEGPCGSSQSPQIGSSVQRRRMRFKEGRGDKSQSPQIGSSVQSTMKSCESCKFEERRNPLKSGQAFKGDCHEQGPNQSDSVAIPSNRVKRSKGGIEPIEFIRSNRSRNPLKSGQAFKVHVRGLMPNSNEESQSPQIGSSVQRRRR